jgi:uncharacterized protein (TIGR03437 family)
MCFRALALVLVPSLAAVTQAARVSGPIRISASGRTRPIRTVAESAAAAPSLAYSTYLRAGFEPMAIATDLSGNVYIAGRALLDATTSQQGALVVKLNPQGTQYLYVRYLAGSVEDSANAITVDNMGNAYIAGYTQSPDFPVTEGGALAMPAGGKDAQRSFVTKLDPEGQVVFSDILGGSAASGAQAIALTPGDNILVSGASSSSGFPATMGAYSVADTAGRPYLLELDATGSKVLFSATGIGGSALALDSAGNIYMAGSTMKTDYPVTPGAYQSAFMNVFYCFGLCQVTFPGVNQYVTKVDPAASKLIYSTPVATPTCCNQTINAGLAVDTAGDVYVTGVTWGAYAYTVTAPTRPGVRPFLTKLDPAGTSALYSIPVGGAGVEVGPDGVVYVGGTYNNYSPQGIDTELTEIAPPPPGVAELPAACQPGPVTVNEAYISAVDSATGNVLGTQLVDGSNLTAVAIALSGGKAWLAGFASAPDVPFTPGALAPKGLGPGPLPGAYVGLVDFLQPVSSSAPQTACLLDGANGSHAGPVAPTQILSLFGANLGPAAGVAAPDGSADSLAGVTVTFDGLPGALLYVSSSQINVAVPATVHGQDSTVVQITVGGIAGPTRQIPVTPEAPNLFADLSTMAPSCPIGPNSFVGGGTYELLARNQDGTLNSCEHPAPVGSVVSFYLNGAGQDPATGFPMAVSLNGRSAEVVSVEAEAEFVARIGVRVPALEAPPLTLPLWQAEVTAQVGFIGNSVPAGPLVIPRFPGLSPPASFPLPVFIWVSE